MDKPLPYIGIDRAYVALLLTEPVAADPTYSTPVRLKGAVEATFNPNANIQNFYADDGVYVSTSRAGDIELDITLAGLEAEIYALLVGADYDSSNGLVEENQNDVPPEFALGFRAQLSDGSFEYNWLKIGVFAKPQQAYATKAETISYQTKPLIFMARPQAFGSEYRQYFNSDDDNFPVGLTDALLINESTGWASDPNFIPSAPGTPIADFAIVSGSGAGELDAAWTAAVGATNVKIQILDPVSGDYQDATTEDPIAVGDALATVTGLTTGNTYTARLVVTSGTNNGISNIDSADAL